MSTYPPAPCFAGIVPSLPHTALALLPRRDHAPSAARVWTLAVPTAFDLNRLAQHRAIAAAVLRALERESCAAGAPTLIAILSHNPRGFNFSHTLLIELGALIRHRLCAQEWSLVEVPATLAALFATGRGQTTPGGLSTQLTAAYGQTFTMPEQAIAYTLAQMARCLMHPDDYTNAQIRSLAPIRHKIYPADVARQRPSVIETP